MNIDDIFIWICMIIAGISVYGGFFVAVTESQKFNYLFMAVLWVILGLVSTTLKKIKKTKKLEVSKWETQ